MSGMAWFRMYAEFATDPKLQMLSESLQRRFVMLLCLRCNGCETLQDEEVTFQLRISNEEWAETKAIFISKNMLDNDNNITNWDKRQYVSDVSTERVRKYRNKKKQKGNVSVTPPDTDTDTEKKNPLPPKGDDVDFLSFWEAYPNKDGKGRAMKAWVQAKKKKTLPHIQAVLLAIEREKQSTKWSREGGRFIPLPATWLNDLGWENGTGKGTGGGADDDRIKRLKDAVDKRGGFRQGDQPAGSILSGQAP